MKFKLFVVGVGKKGTLQDKMSADDIINQKNTQFDYMPIGIDFDLNDFKNIKNNSMQIDYKHNEYFETSIETPSIGILKVQTEDGVICHFEVIKTVNNMVYGECEYDIYAKLLGYDINESKTRAYQQSASSSSGSGSQQSDSGQSNDMVWKDEDGVVRTAKGVYKKIGEDTYFLNYSHMDYTEVPFYSHREKDIFYYLFVTSTVRPPIQLARWLKCEIEKIQFDDNGEEWIVVENETTTDTWSGWWMWGFKLRFKPYVPKDDKRYRSAKVYVYQPDSGLRIVVPLVQVAELAEVKTVLPQINSSNPGYKMFLNEDIKMNFLRDETGLKQMIIPRVQQNKFGILANKRDGGYEFKEGHFSFAFTSKPDIDAKKFLETYKNGPDSVIESMCYHWIYNIDPIPIYATYTFDRNKLPSDNMFLCMSNINPQRGYDETNYLTTATNTYGVGSEVYKQTGKNYGDRLCYAYLIEGEYKTVDELHNALNNSNDKQIAYFGQFYFDTLNELRQDTEYLTNIKSFCENCTNDRITLVVEYLCYTNEENGHFVYPFLNYKSKENQTTIYNTPRLLIVEDDEHKSLFNTLYGKVYGNGGRRWYINYWLSLLAPVEDGSEMYRDIRCLIE